MHMNETKSPLRKTFEDGLRKVEQGQTSDSLREPRRIIHQKLHEEERNEIKDSKRTAITESKGQVFSAHTNVQTAASEEAETTASEAGLGEQAGGDLGGAGGSRRCSQDTTRPQNQLF